MKKTSKNNPPPRVLRGGKLIKQLNYYSEFPPELRKKIKAFDKRIKKSERKFKEGQIFSENKVYEKISWDLLKEKSRELCNMKNTPIFLFIPNSTGIMVPVLQEEMDKVPVRLISRSIKGINHFIDEGYDERYFSEMGNITMNYFKYFVSIDGVICPFYCPFKISGLGVPYFFSAVKVPLKIRKRSISGMINSVENVYLCNSVNKIKENFGMLDGIVKNIKNIHDLTLVWDFDNDRSIYSEEETYIILSNIFYLEEGNCALDLILCGKPSSKKTAWLDILKEIFSDNVVMSVNATDKSLVPSFYFETPKPGALCDSKYITLLDDYFRMFSQKSEKAGYYVAIKNGLESVMNLLDRKEKTIPSGKKDLSVKYNASFFATDNFGYHDTLVKIYDDDPAILRRYTFLILSDETEERGTSVCERDINEVISLIKKKLKKKFSDSSFEKYRLLFVYLRNIVQKISFDIYKFQSIVKKYNKYDIYIQGKAKALMKSIIALNTILRWEKDGMPKLNDFKATEQDYDLFEKLLARTVNDFLKATKRINIET